MSAVEKSRNSRNAATSRINIGDFLLRLVEFVAACDKSKNGATGATRYNPCPASKNRSVL